jgi:hypothetical protein
LRCAQHSVSFAAPMHRLSETAIKGLIGVTPGERS